LYNFSNKIIIVSQEEKNNLINNFNIKPEKIETIYNSIDIEKINILKNEHLNKEYMALFENWKKTFIHIWRLSKEKNQKFLLEAFNQFNKNYKKTQLIILWDWYEYNNLISYKDTLENKNNIHFLWMQENVYNFLNKSDYLVMSSNYEWFPMVFIEAMALWIPIITHDFKTWAKECIRQNENLSECKEIEIHDNWILIPYMDKEKFIEWLEKWLKTNFNKNRIIKNSEIFNINNTIKQWIKVIESE